MRSVIKALLAASMLIPAAAQAQDGARDYQRRGDAQGQWRDRGERTQPEPGARQQPQQQGGFRDRDDIRGDRGQNREPRWRGEPGDVRVERDRPSPNGFRDDPRRPGLDRGEARGDRFRPGLMQGRPAPAMGYDRGRFDDRGGGTWNRGWRNQSRYDWNGYRAGNRGAYRLPRYYAPRGWGYGYRRFPVGVTLSSVLWNENYWIDDPWSYRLPDAYGPYRWVRYYDDALLVDLRGGRVVDTVYDIFD